jgi:hypothetical protein
LTALCPSKHYNQARRNRHKTLTEWARQLILQLRRWLPGRQLVIVGDNSFAAIDLLAAIQRHETTMVTRLRLDAALYKPAPPRSPHAIGRPPKKGERLPKLEERLTDPKTQWRSVEASWWYGHEEKALEIATGTAVWYNSGKPVVPLRWVLVRDPGGELESKDFCALTRRPSRPIFYDGSSGGGPWRLLSRKCADTWAGNPAAVDGARHRANDPVSARAVLGGGADGRPVGSGRKAEGPKSSVV